MILAVLLLLSVASLSDLRQMTAATQFAQSHNVGIRALTHDGGAAVSMVESHEVDAVLTAVEPQTGFPSWLVDQVRACGGQLIVVRRRLSVVRDIHDARTDLVRIALANSGNDYRLVSRLLGMSESSVRRMAREEVKARA